MMGTNREPAWSPDGRYIAFEHYGGNQTNAIFKIRANGSEPTRLTHTDKPFKQYRREYDTQPAWSPDGKHIAFTRNGRYGPSKVYAMLADGTGETKLTPAGGNPAWSPDGRKIVFVSYRDGQPEIYKMNATGSGQIKLTDNPASDNDPDWGPLPS
jgi:Tol biopolymer transport system component